VQVGATQRLKVGLLARDHLDHARRGDAHGAHASHHDREVAKDGCVRGTRDAGAIEHADLGDDAAENGVVVEVAADAAHVGEEPGLVRDARARGVDKVEDGPARLEGTVLNAKELLDAALGHGAGLDRVVVGLEMHQAVVDSAHARDHAVGRKLVLGEVVCEQPVLELGSCGEEQAKPVADKELARFGQGLFVLGRSALLDLARLFQNALHAVLLMLCGHWNPPWAPSR
jgi:hypothetical protein